MIIRGAPNEPPGAPTGLTAAATGQTQINLSWTAPTRRPAATAISGYKIEVSTDGSTWTDLAADTGSTATTYEDTGLTAGSTRHYRVSAINSIGTGTASDTTVETTDVLVGNAFQGSDGSTTLANQSISTTFTTGSNTAGLHRDRHRGHLRRRGRRRLRGSTSTTPTTVAQPTTLRGHFEPLHVDDL